MVLDYSGRMFYYTGLDGMSMYGLGEHISKSTPSASTGMLKSMLGSFVEIFVRSFMGGE
jgi:hypothetical protein